MNKNRYFYENLYHFEEDFRIGIDENRLENFFKDIHFEEVNTCLDIGCGVGGALNYLFQKKPSGNTLYVGIEISEKALILAKRNLHRKIDLLVGDGERLPFSSSCFDLVISLGTIEHFKNPAQGLIEIARVSRENAQVVLVVPNSYWLMNRLNIYAGTEQPQEMLATIGEWSRLFRNYNLKIYKIRKDVGPPVFKNNNIIPIIKRVMVKSTVFLPVSFAYQFIFYCRKK